MKIYTYSALLCAGLLLGLRPAAAESNHCTAITSLPTTLSNEGVYCLTQDLSLAGSSGMAVTIAADSVTLDLNGHAVRNDAAANTTTIGVGVSGHKYFTITDGTIAGFAQGVYVGPNGSTNAKGGMISNLKVQRSFYSGLTVICDGCVVRDNTVTDTNLPASITGYPASGISMGGTGDQIIGNRVFNTYSSAMPSYAISIGASNSTIANNYVVNGSVGATAVYGFLISGANALLTGNQAQGFPYCYWLQAVNMKYRDNLSGGCTDAIDGGASGGNHDLGGNN